MKRPLAAIGFSILISMMLLIFVENTVIAFCVLVLSAVLVAVFTFLKFRQASLCAVICFGIALACLLFMHSEYNRQKTLSLCGENVSVEAVITQEPVFSHSKGRFYFETRLKTLRGEKAYGKIRLSFSETYDGIDAQSLFIGDKISFSANTYRIGQNVDSIHDYYCSLGIYSGGYGMTDLTVEPPEIRSLNYYVNLFREWMVKKIRFNFDKETAGLVIAILVGDKDFVSDEIYSDFKKSGAAHIMAVSGMHLSVWILFFSLLLDRFKKHRVLINSVLMIITVLVMFIASFTPSVMRAGVMVLLALSGKCINRNADSVNSLGFSCAVLLLSNPYMAVNTGFLLSVFSVLSIFILGVPSAKLLSEKLKNKLKGELIKKLSDTVVTSVCISVGVTVFTFPILVYAFGGISLVSPLTNLLLFPVVTPFMVLSACFVAFSSVPYLSTVISLAVNALSEYILGVTNLATDLPFSYMAADYRHVIFWLILVVFIAVASVLITRKRNFAFKITCSIIAFSIVFSLGYQIKASISQCKIIPVKTDTDCAYIVSMNSRGVIIGMSEDYYFDKNLSDVLSRENITPDVFIYTGSTDSDEAEYLLRKYGIKNSITRPGDSAVLFGDIKIVKQEGFVSVEGNGISVAIFENEGLQTEHNCDIIINNYGLLSSGTENGLFAAEPFEYLTLKNGGNISVGR